MRPRSRKPRPSRTPKSSSPSWVLTLPELLLVFTDMLCPLVGQDDALTCAELLQMLSGMGPDVPVRVVFGEPGSNMQVQASGVFSAKDYAEVVLPAGLLLGTEAAVSEALQIAAYMGTETPPFAYHFSRCADGCTSVESLRDLLRDLPEAAGSMPVLIVGRTEESGDPRLYAAHTICHNIPGLRGPAAPGEYEHICIADRLGIEAMQRRGTLAWPMARGGDA